MKKNIIFIYVISIICISLFCVKSKSDFRNYWCVNALNWARETYGIQGWRDCDALGLNAKDVKYEYAKSHPEDSPYNYGTSKEAVDKYLRENGYSNIIAIYSGTSAPSTTTASVPANATQPVVEKHTHSYTEKLTTAPTCTDKGLKTFTCSCGDSYTEEVEPLGHSYSEPAIEEATCTTDGSSTVVCEVCGEEIVDIIKALDHDFNTTPTINAANCITDGLMTYKCSRCEELQEEVIPAYGHTTSDWIIDKPNGMFTKGSQHKECLDCKEVMESSEIPSTYPIWYLYCGIGLVIVIIGIITGIVIKKRNK